MKTVVIPITEKKYWECEINGVTYRYEAGTTQSVPDEVASVIANIYGMTPTPAPAPGTVGQVWTRTSEGAEWESIPAPEKELPPVTVLDYGKVLKVNSVNLVPTVQWSASDIPGYTPADDGKVLTVEEQMDMSIKHIWKALPDATEWVKGVVKQGTAVAPATSTSDVVTQLNALIAALEASGAIATYTAPTT